MGESRFEVEGLEWKLTWTSRITMSAWEVDIYIVQKSFTNWSVFVGLQNSIT